jgi:hypothetical protein
LPPIRSHGEACRSSLVSFAELTRPDLFLRPEEDLDLVGVGYLFTSTLLGVFLYRVLACSGKLLKLLSTSAFIFSMLMFTRG